MIDKSKKQTKETTTKSSALLECIKTVLADLFGNKEGCDELARTMVEEWNLKGSVSCPKTVNIPSLMDGMKAKLVTSFSTVQRKQAEALVLPVLRRHGLLAHFTETVCDQFEDIDRSMGFSYDAIVREVNFPHFDTVLEYPCASPKTPPCLVEEIKKKRLETEQVIKLWYRQLHRHDKKRLPDFTNDEAWLAMLETWTDNKDYTLKPIWGQECLVIAPSEAPDCHWKFLHMKKLHRGNFGREKHLLEFVPLLGEDWPVDYWNFKWALKDIDSKKKYEQSWEDDDEEDPYWNGNAYSSYEPYSRNTDWRSSSAPKLW